MAWLCDNCNKSFDVLKTLRRYEYKNYVMYNDYGCPHCDSEQYRWLEQEMIDVVQGTNYE